MNTTTKQEQSALTVPQRAAVALGTAEHEIKLRELLTNSVRIVAPTNKAARDECHAAYMVLKNARCSIVNLAADATEDAKAFTKAVKTESDRLIAITSVEEDRLQGLRDAWDATEQARKDALIAAERQRTERITGLIDAIKAIPSKNATSNSTALRDALLACASMAIGAEFEEFRDKAAEALDSTIHDLEAMIVAVEKREQEVAAAEEARIAEADRIAEERAELARQQAAAAIVAAEQEAERKRLAAAADALAEASRKEQAERDRIAADVKRQLDEQQAQIAAQARALAEQQAAADARDAAAKATAQDAQRLADDHGPALAMNAQFDADRAAELARCTETAKAMLTNGRNLSDTAIEALSDAGDDPSDKEIIELVCETFDMTMAHAIERVRVIAFDELLVGVA